MANNVSIHLLIRRQNYYNVQSFGSCYLYHGIINVISQVIKQSVKIVVLCSLFHSDF